MVRHIAVLLAVLALPAGLGAVEAVPPKPVPPEAKPAEAKPVDPPRAAPTTLDPTAAVVAEGRYTYHQRDLDALVQIAQRHARGKLSKADEESLRQALLAALTAREPLLEAVAMLPPNMTSHAREQLVLDLLAYQAEPAKVAAPPSGEPGAAPVPADAGKPAAVPATAADGPVLIRLPPLTLNRTVEGSGKRQLVLGIALFFKDPALAKSLEAKAPLIQDAIIGYVQKLPGAQFLEPDQALLKSGLAKAVIAKIPEFPGDGILIPQLDATAGDAEAPKAP